MNDNGILNAFDEIERSLQGRMVVMKVTESETLENLCDTYWHVRAWLETILPAIDRISKGLSSIIRLLMQIADTACPVPYST